MSSGIKERQPILLQEKKDISINVNQVSFNLLIFNVDGASFTCEKHSMGLSTRWQKHLKTPPPERLMRNKGTRFLCMGVQSNSLTLIHHSRYNFYVFLVEKPVVCATTSRKRISSLKMLDYVYYKCKAVQPFYIGAYWSWSRFNFRSKGKGLLLTYYGEIKTDLQDQEQTCDEDNLTSPKEKGCHCVRGIIRS